MKKAGTDKGNPQSFEEALRQKLDEVNAAPKSTQWERLEAGLDQHTFIKNDRKSYYAIVAAILLLLVSGGIYHFTQTVCPTFFISIESLLLKIIR